MKRFPTEVVHTFFCALVALLLASCHGEEPTEQPSQQPADTSKSTDVPLPVNTTPFAEDLPRDTYRASIVQQGNIVYFVGGLDADNHPVAKLRAYDLTTKSWEEKASMQFPRYDVNVVAMDGKIYAIAGRYGSDSNSMSGVIERYDLATNTWERLEGIPSYFRYSIEPKTWVGAPGALFTVASSNGTAKDSTISLYVLDFSVGKWARYSKSGMPRLIEPTLMYFDDKVYILGRRYYDSTRNHLFIFDFDATRAVVKQAPKFIERGTLTRCFFHDNRIYKVNASIGSPSVMEIYDMATDTWSQVPVPYPYTKGEALDPIVTDTATGEVYFFSPPRVTHGFHFDPRTVTFSAR